MKRLYAVIILSCFVFSAHYRASAQMVGDCVFLKGKYVEVGVAPNGGYGSTVPAPAGYHPNIPGTGYVFYDPALAATTPGGSYLGFVADYGADGWTVGSPGFFGDYYLPGTPQEGWAIRVGDSEGTAYIPRYQLVPSTGYGPGSSFPAPTLLPLTGTSTAYINSGGISKGVWTGTAGTGGYLKMRQTTTLDTNKLYFTVNVVIKNTSTATSAPIYYMRTVDPDNEQTATGSYTTINSIAYQLPNPTNRVLVSTTGNSLTNAYLGLGTKDCRAKCMIFGGGLTSSYNMQTMWNETASGFFYTQGSTYTSDVGIALEFQLGTLAAGDSTSLSYAYILNATYIDSALNATSPVYKVNGVVHDSTDTIDICSYPYDTIDVSITGGDFYHWHWAPDSFLTDTVGTHVVIHSDSITSDITYTITGTNTAGGCNSKVYTLTVLHGTFPGPVTTTTSYCEGAPTVPLTAPGTGLMWYTSATGGTGSSTAPTPSSAVAGTFVWWVTESVGLCTSQRSPDTVIIKPLPPPPLVTGIDPYCQGQTFVPFTTTGTGILWYNTLTGGTGSSTAPTVNTGVPGTYTYYASQTVNGCEGPRRTITTNVLDSIIPSFSYVVHWGCHGDTVLFSNGSINATNYSWLFGDGHVDTAVNPTHVFLTQDTFNVVLYGVNGACVDSQKASIELMHPIAASFTHTPDIACQGIPFSFTNTSTGTGLSYSWDLGNGATAGTTDLTYVYNNSGTYQVRMIATDFVPCSDTAYATIYVDTISNINIGLTDSVLCMGTYVTFTGLYASLGNTGVTWNFGDNDSIKNINPVYHNFSVSTPTTYTVTVTATYRACPTVSTTKTVTVYPQPVINLGDDTSICAGSNPIVLNDIINGGHPGAHWTWSTGETGSSITITSPGTYYATVDIDNCASTDSIHVVSDCYIDIPNVFTPNGDGVNDYFFPRQLLAKGLTTFNMGIYNRWGQLIFESKALDGRGWDGSLNNVPQPQGVFVYIIDVTFKDGQKEHHQGNVTLLR